MKKINILIAAILMTASFSLTAQVAITTDGSSADGSAKLDVKSTTKGMLYPRMTLTQRQSISSPATGLMIYNLTTNKPNYFNGTEWKTCDGTTGAAAIGDSYQGGIIFYILQSGDPGYDANVLHGLIAPTSDQSAGIAWITGGSTQSALNNNTLTALGTGQANTNFMMAQTDYTGGAAKVCNDYSVTVGGVTYSDWYLPSKDELNKLYLNNAVVGGFVTSNDYWSSSESGQQYAWVQFLTTGGQASNNKSATNPVRAIRAF